MSGRRSTDYTQCPKCGRQTVLFRRAPRGEDSYACIYRRHGGGSCDWSTNAYPKHWDTQGQADLAAWRELNSVDLEAQRG
jgi:hypothetical protein